MAGIVLFIIKCESRNSFNHKVKDENFRKNYFRMFRLHLPHMDAVNDVLEKIDAKKMEEILCRIISSLIEKRVFHQYRFFSKSFCIAVDATGVYNWGENPLEDISKHALKKTSKNDKVSRFTLVLSAVLICSNGMTIPMLNEWIANDGEEYIKQDCELKAFKRLTKRLKSYFPRLPITLLVDGLYTNVALMDICQEYDWEFITVFKDGNLPNVWEEVHSLRPLNKKNSATKLVFCDRRKWYTHNYTWLNDIEYQKHKIQCVECIVEEEKGNTQEEETKRFVFLTNKNVSGDNIDALLKAGRARWEIEDLFNTQKNRGYALHHKFSRVCFNAIKNWHSIRQLAFLICEFVEYTQELKAVMKKMAAMTLKELWNNMNWFLTMCDAEETIDELEHWSKLRRQIRLE